MKKIHYIYIALFLGILFVSSCEKMDYYSGSDARVAFSTDTIAFDTVFTTIGSATLNFRVYNSFDQPININNVSISGGEDSPFRMNVDGRRGKSVDDIKVYAKDSIYVFVEVTVDPNDQNLPLLIDDSIAFTINNNIQYVNLEAYGQDAYHFKAHPDSNYLALSTQTFTGDKPYMIHDNLFVNDDAILTIEQGAVLHFRKDKSLFVGGTLKIDGTREAPVALRGDRLDDVFDGFAYDQVPGQWGYVHLLAGSKNNEINHASIRNSIIGIQVDSTVTPGVPTLKISNSIIENCTSIGLYAQGAYVVGENCVFANCAQVVVGLVIGGEYEFTHCTMGNFYDFAGGRSEPSVYVNNYYFDIFENLNVRPLKKATFKNCIIWGSNADELYMDNTIDDQPINAPFNYMFDHCLIRTRELVDTSDVEHYTNIIWNKDPNFIEPSSTGEANFQLDTLSFAKDAGFYPYAELIPADILGVDRLADDGPDFGAYERVEKVVEE